MARAVCRQRVVQAANRDDFSCATLFRDWASQRGVLYPKLELTVFENGLRGMRALERLTAGEIAVQLPRESALVIEPTTRSPDGFPDKVWKLQPWFVKLAIRLMVERMVGNSSYFSGYTLCLPDKADLPCLWPDEDIMLLRSPPLIEAIKSQKEEWDRATDELMKAALDKNWDRAEFLRCLAFVRSRSFSGPYIGSKLKDRIRLGAIILLLSIANILLTGLNSIEQTLNAILAVSTFNILYEFFLSQRLKVYLLAPAADFMNHSSLVSCDISYDYFTDGYSVRLDRDYKKNEQVFISYGKKSNDELLQYFGFVEKDNPQDTVYVKDGMQKLYQIVKKKTKAEPGELGDIEFKDVEVYRDGFSDVVLDTLNRWIRQTGADKNLITAVLIEFCEAEAVLWEPVTSADKDSRAALIEDFRREKHSVLTKCIKALETTKEGTH